ncbi:MAG: DMT family transporter [bacterium]|nr:DMT family transporter [bacterium]
MLWLNITILAYFIFAVVFLIDKYLLVKAVPNPKVYAFFIGIAGFLLLIIVPFIDFYIPDLSQLILSFLAGGFSIYALYRFFKALQLFDASQVVPAVGALAPLFTFFLVYIFSLGKESLSPLEFFSFLLLIAGSILITLEKGKSINLQAFKMSLIAAFFFALSFVLTKYVYLEQPFLNGLVWTRLGGALMASAFFIFSSSVRQEISRKKEGLQKKAFGILVINQTAGAGAGFLQNWAIALAPLAYVSIINALQGVQYVFLLIFTIILSLRFPQIIKEKISKEILSQKIIAILLIGSGLAILVL